MATLRHRWKFDENTGQYAYDSAGTNNLKLYDTTSGDRHVTWEASGYKGACLKGDGANTGIASNIGAVSDVDGTELPKNISITAWFKTTSSTSKAFLYFAPDENFLNYDMWFVVSSASYGSTYVAQCGYMYLLGTYEELRPPITPTPPASNDGNWHFVCFTTDSTGPTSKFYIDDCETPVETANSQPDNGITGNYRWRIGAGAGAFYTRGAFDGLVDDIRIYDGVLTPTEICAVKIDFEAAVKNAIMFSCNT